MIRTNTTNSRMVRKPSKNVLNKVKAIMKKDTSVKLVEEQEAKRTELVQEIKDFELTDIYTCQEKICKIEDAKKQIKKRNISDYMK